MPNSSQNIIDALRKIVRSLRIASGRVEHDLGMSSAQLFVLQKLGETPEPKSLTELSDATLTDLSSVSVVVSKLEQHGLIKKVLAKGDGRRLEVNITAKGKRILSHRRVTYQERLIKGIETLTKPQQRQVAKLLNKIIDGAGFGHEKASMFFEESRPKKRRRDR